MSGPQRFTQVDAFTDRPFAGNPAAVCILDGPRDERWMQDLAREMNLSETAFLLKSDAGDSFGLRWFTPTIEVDLCGHATLASAHALWEEGHLTPDAPAFFDTRSGRLVATKQGDWITLDFPATPPKERADVEVLSDALGIAVGYAGKTAFDVLCEIARESDLKALRPDMAKLAALPHRGVIVTSRSNREGVDFVSRFFAPAAGVNEDPVTGSAHCALGPYWSALMNKAEFVAEQISERGGVIRVSLVGDRVHLSGRAVTVLRGELTTAADPR